MSTLYETIMALCQSRGIKGARLCSDLGISKGLLTDLKMGRRSGISAVTAQKIAGYFGVSVGYLLGQEDRKNAPPEARERNISDEELKFALWGDCQEVDEADLEDVRRYAAFLRERKQKK